jgi:hypothetical protein
MTAFDAAFAPTIVASSVRPDEHLLIAILTALVVLAFLPGIRGWQKHRKETPAWLSGGIQGDDSRAMRWRGLRVVLFVGLIALAIAAWEGAFAATPRPSPLASRVIGHGEFKGYTPGAQHSYNTPSAYIADEAPSQRNADIARLTSEGFKAGLTEDLYDAQGPQSGPGVSDVMQLGSAASARAELAAQKRLVFRGFIRFPVKTIPGAVGFRGRGGENVLFADGPFVYLVGYGWFEKPLTPPRHSALIDAATKLYTRIHRHSAG